MMIKNPNFADPVAAYVESRKTAIQNFLAAQPADKRFITADEIRASFPAEAAKLTDGTIAEICRVLGLKIVQGGA